MASLMRFTLLLLATLLLFAAVSPARATEEGDDDLEEGLGDVDDSEDFDYSGMSQGFGEDFDESDVVVLGSSNFTEFVKSKQYVLVEFYAPWCGHCQSLAPEYAKAATVLKDKVDLVKVDATKHEELSQEYGVEGFPTLYFFIDGDHKPYTGGRTSDEIVTWLKKKTGPAVDIVKSTSEAQELLESDTPLAVAYLKSLEGKDAEEYIAAARQEDGVLFYMTADAEIAKTFGLDKKTPALVLLKKQNEKVSTFDGSFERNALGDFVLENKLPLVITFSRETASSIFDSDVNRQLLLFAHPAEFEKISANYEEAAKSFKRKLIYVLVDLANEEVAAPVLEFFSLQGDKTKLMGFVVESSGAKYLYDGDFTVDSLKEFSEKFLADDLTPYLKSESAPEKNDEDVKVVVGENFDEIVLDDSKDVLLEVYAPWCGHCQALEPEYNKLAEVLKNVSSIVIAKMDGTKNEHARVKIEGFPSILLYPAGKKTEDPVLADTERTVSGLVKFLSSNAAVPFEAPDVPEDPETPSEEEEGEEGDEVEGEHEGDFDFDRHFGAAKERDEDDETEDGLKDEL